MRNLIDRDVEILTVSNVANLLNCAASTVRRRADAGEIPVKRDGNDRRIFRAADIAQLVRVERSRR